MLSLFVTVTMVYLLLFIVIPAIFDFLTPTSFILNLWTAYNHLLVIQLYLSVGFWLGILLGLLVLTQFHPILSLMHLCLYLIGAVLAWNKYTIWTKLPVTTSKWTRMDVLLLSFPPAHSYNSVPFIKCNYEWCILVIYQTYLLKFGSIKCGR